MTLVAPREIVDLVYRCCRMASLDPGSADVIARAAAEAELSGLEGLADCVRHHTSGSLGAVVDALRAIDVAEVSVRASGEPVTVDFESSVAGSLLNRRLRQAQGRSVVSVPAAQGTQVDGVRLSRRDAPTVAIEAPSRRGYVEGVEVDSAVFEAATRIAASFLVSEAVLDAAIPE